MGHTGAGNSEALSDSLPMPAQRRRQQAAQRREQRKDKAAQARAWFDVLMMARRDEHPRASRST